MTPRVCAEPGCPTLVEAGQSRCPAHTRKPWAGAGNGRGGRPWQRLRQLILIRDHHRCIDCGAPATQVDHLDRLADGGPLIAPPDRLASLCTPCHQAREQQRNRDQQQSRP